MNKFNKYFDINHIWHPYTSLTNPLPCYYIDSAKGFYLKMKNGKKLIDGMSSWWSVIHGYNNPRLNLALNKQIRKMTHVMFGGITHTPAIKLCKKLLKITPIELNSVFLADSGSVAIEVAMKMAIQYWQALGKKKKYFLTIKNGYHGDTFLAISVSDPNNAFHHTYDSFIKKNLFATAPICKFNDIWNHDDIFSFNQLIDQFSEKIVAVILEPIVQGVGGMHFYHPNYLRSVRKLCNSYEIPLIIDEIATGFGRTGKLFASEHANVVADILCLGKSLTGGTMTLSAVLTTKLISDTISNGKIGTFMHGPTFMGNPLACSVAEASISILEENIWKTQVKDIENQLYINLIKLSNHSRVKDIRVLGAIGVVECYDVINISKIQKFFVKNGVWIRPFKNLIYLTPPYIIDIESLQQLIEIIAKSLENPIFFISNSK
ncbi:Adenosylmethionine-8-amino-7-oxononanoate aminotransferase [Buchnera aphidicola (Eriosoma lanigerum)]|uniref:adenosylmethionine--8-amino-7-oxononanoate transaminase n=1 Tax=Buchnera aphidicola TaxID=9 RepID=UPI003464C2E2